MTNSSAVSFLEPLKNILEKVGWDHEHKGDIVLIEFDYTH